MSTTRKRKAKVFRIGDVTLAVEYKVEKWKDGHGSSCGIALKMADLSYGAKVFEIYAEEPLGWEERLLNQYHKFVDFLSDAGHALGNMPEPKVEKKDDTNEE